MATTPKQLATAVCCFLALLLGFVLLRFPFAAVGRRLAVEVEKITGGAVSLEFGRGRWGLDGAIVFENGRLGWAGGGVVTLDSLRLSPDLSALFAADPAGFCRLALLGGEIRMRLRGNAGAGAITVEAADLALDELPLRLAVGAASLSGRLSGRFQGERAASGRLAGEGELFLADGRVRVQGLPAEVADLSFSALKAPLRLKDNRLTFAAVTWRGRQTAGEAQGSVEIDFSRPGRSPLAFTGRFRILPELFGRLQQEGLPVELLAGGADAEVPFRITGTLHEWSVSLHEE